MAKSALGALVLKFVADTKDLRAGIRESRQRIRRFGESVRKNIRRATMVAAAALAAGTAAVLKFGRSVLGAADQAEQLRLRLDALLGSTEEGARAFDMMRKFAAGVPFEFENIMRGATQLAGVVEGGADEIAGLMPLIADIAAVSGLSIDKATEQIVRAFSAGIGAADLFRERGITAMLGLQGKATVSAVETRRAIISEWKKTDSQFRGAAADMADTWTGLMSMFADRWFSFRVLVSEAGFFDAVKDAAKDLLQTIDQMAMSGELEHFARQIGHVLTESLESAVEFARTSLPDLRTMAAETINAVNAFFLFGKVVVNSVRATASVIKAGMTVIIEEMRAVAENAGHLGRLMSAIMEGNWQLAATRAAVAWTNWRTTTEDNFNRIVDAAEEANERLRGLLDAGEEFVFRPTVRFERGKVNGRSVLDPDGDLGGGGGAGDAGRILDRLGVEFDPFRAQQAVDFIDNMIETGEEAGETFTDSLSDKLRQGGKHAISSLVEGMLRGTRDTGDLIKGIGLRIASMLLTQGLFSALNIASPSGKGIFVGRMLGLGIVEGMESTMSLVRGASDRLASAAMPQMGGARMQLAGAGAQVTQGAGRMPDQLVFDLSNTSPHTQWSVARDPLVQTTNDAINRVARQRGAL